MPPPHVPLPLPGVGTYAVSWTSGTPAFGKRYDVYSGIKNSGVKWGRYTSTGPFVGETTSVWVDLGFSDDGQKFRYDPDPFFNDSSSHALVSESGAFWTTHSYRSNASLTSPYDQSSVAYWDGVSFKHLFGGEDTDTSVFTLNSALKMFGFSPRFTGAYQAPGIPPAPHPFWIEGGQAQDFYLKLPEKFRKQIRFRWGAPGSETTTDWAFLNDSNMLAVRAQVLEGTSGTDEDWAGTGVILCKPSTAEVRQMDIGGARPHMINQHGILAAGAQILVPMEVSYFTRRWKDGTFEEQNSFLYEADPSPVIELSVVSSAIDPETGSVTVVTDCRVRDPLSETLSDQEYRLKEVKLLVNGAEVETVNLTGPAVGTAVDVWAPHPSERTLRRTFSIANATVGTQIISAVTGTNKAWRQGTAQIGVVVDEERDANGQPVQGANGPRLRIAAAKPTTHSAPGFFDSYVTQIRASASLTSWLTGSNAPALKLNGESVHLVERAGLVNADPLPPGYKDFYLAAGHSPQSANEQPKLFIIAEENADDPIPTDTKTYSLNLTYGGFEQVLDERSLVRLPEALHMLASSAGVSATQGQSETQSFGGPAFEIASSESSASAASSEHTPRYNENQVKFAFECIYGEPGIAILAAYQSDERRCSVLVQPMASIITGHYRGDNEMGGIDFIIDDDYYANAFEAAQGLWVEMRSIQGANSVANVALALQWEQFDNQTGDIARLYSPHHDLPHELENQFLLAGLDPNDGFFFGRAVKRTTHDEWHKVGGFGPGGPFNKLWWDFFDRYPNGTKPTAGEIIEYLEYLKAPASQPIIVTSTDGTKTAALYLAGWE